MGIGNGYIVGLRHFVGDNAAAEMPNSQMTEAPNVRKSSSLVARRRALARKSGHLVAKAGGPNWQQRGK